MADISHPPSGGFQNGGWYWDPSSGAARQYWQGQFGPPGDAGANWWQKVGGDTSQANTQPSANPADDFMKSVLDDITKPLKDAMTRASDFDKNNPFVFDEQLAESSAKERLNPYYDAELKDYISGVNRAKGQTAQDTDRLLKDLNTTTEQTTGAIKQNLDETIRDTQEGYANTGLLSSGTQERATGKAEVQGDNTLSSFIQGQDSKQQQIASTAKNANDNTDAQLSTYQRRLNAERETSLTNDVNQQKQESEQRHELERQNYIGYPVASGASSLSSIFGLS
jgi:hypothetical protein